MRLDPEQRVIAADNQPPHEQVLRVAVALATGEYVDMPWDDIPLSEQFRFMKKARAFIAASSALKHGG